MKITLDTNYNAKTDFTALGYVGETNARIITIEGYRCGGADSYKMRFKYPDDVVYDIDINSGTYTIEGSILRRVGAVYVQILAGHYVDGKYDYVKKSNTFTLQIGRSLKGDVAPVPTYEKSVEALEKVLEAEKSSSENASKAESASNAAQAAQNAAEQAKQTTVKLAANAEKAAENAAQSETAAQTAANTATDKAAEISKSADQIQKNTDDIARLCSKSDGIVCNAEGASITLNDSAEMPFSGMKIFGRSTQDGTPSPDNPVPIVSVGDSGKIETEVFGGNLLDIIKTKSETKTYATGEQVRLINNGDGALTVKGTTPESTYYVSSQLANVFTLPNGNYVCSCNKIENGIQIIFRCFYSDGTYKNTILTHDATKQVFAVDGDVTKIVFFTQVKPGFNVDTTFRVMLNRGAEALLWEPYKHQTLTVPIPNGLPGIPVTSGGNYTDENGQQWICDEIDFGRGVYVQRVGKWQYTSEETNIELYKGANRFCVIARINNVKQESYSGYCNILNYACNPIVGNKVNNTIAVYGSGNIYARCDDYQTADDFKTVMADKRPICLYILAEPIETPLTAEEIAAYKPLHTNKPTTTITNSDNAHMTVSYTADTKAYIDNKFNELATAIIATGGDT